MTFARTKIQPPRPRASYVERRGVQARLADALLDKRLVLLCAPAGYGKTTLLAHQLAQLPASTAVAWVAADAGDDLARLLECMLAALEPYDPPWRAAPESLIKRVGTSDEEQRAVAADIINTLDACDVAHGIIAFDDLHRVDDAAFFTFLDLLIERLGSRWSIAVTTRVDPPLALARLRGRGEVAEFRQLQLQFARNEARSLALHAGVDIVAADRLFDRTQGWPAAMRIALGTVQGGIAGNGVALRASERPLFEFFVAEVLEQLEPPLADFLLAVSVLAELDAERCAAVTGDTHAAARLAEIERLGLCVDELDAPTRTLRLHDLVRDALQARLAQTEPERLSALRRRAADTEPDPIRRIGGLLQSGDTAAAEKLAFETLPTLIVTAGASAALHVVGQFPADLRERSPQLSYVRALAYWSQWNFRGMLVQFERAVAGFAARADSAGGQHARVQRVMALMTQGRLDEAGAELAALRTEPLALETRILLLNAEIWQAIDDARHAAVAPLLAEMVDLLQQVDRIDLWYQTSPPLRMPGLPGVTAVLERHAELMLRVAGDAPTPLRALGLLSQAWCSLWRGRLGDARALVESAREDAAWSGESGAVRAHMMGLDAVLACVRGDVRTAIESATKRFESFAGTSSGWQRYVLALFTARVVAACGTDDALFSALERLDAERAGLAPAAIARVGRRELPLRAQLAWLRGQQEEAVAAWQEALGDEEAIDLMGQAAETRLRLASALLVRGNAADRNAAAEVLKPVFGRVVTEGGPMGALLAGEPLRQLATAKWGSTLPVAQQSQLRAWWTIVADSRGNAPVTAGRADAGREVAGVLTARELDVLARIAAGDSNKLIARALDLSLHTVKRHVANILGKLNVQTRGQAAARFGAQPRRPVM
jgi:LuxR family transcriptional regulator, maltose regulon positive regulatory protein